MSTPHRNEALFCRLRDLADVLELVRVAELPRELALRLDPSVRAKYLELWEAAQGGADEE